MTMIAPAWESLSGDPRGDGPGEMTPRLREQPSPIGQLLGQHMLDEAVRALQEDLALLQAGQEQGLHALSAAVGRMVQELGSVREQLGTLGQIEMSPGGPAIAEAEFAALMGRVEQAERQVLLLLRGMETIDGLRHQVGVHTQAIARLTDLLTLSLQPRPVEGLEELWQSVAQIERRQVRLDRVQLLALGLTALSALPGLGALLWLLARAAGI